MINFNDNNIKKIIDDEKFVLLFGDSFKLLKEFPDNSVDVIFADPPYFLSNDGVTCRSGKMVSVNKAKWDKEISVEEKLEYNRLWIRECRRILKDDGTIWISGTMHNIYTVGTALELEGYNIINNIIWQKSNPPPNLACRAFTHSTETVLWARKQLTKNKKGKHKFNYALMREINGGKQMKDVWTFSITPPRERKEGKFPTQKPISLLERIILASTDEGDIILDPFLGSGTTGIVAHRLKRKFIGIDKDKNAVELSVRRYERERENEEKL